ncbi:MAG: hypothetical protein P8N63_00585, partial [Pseudomonadales bacterium]|nr:hypothetical protein [Pseudomonadales bacterium]
RDLTKQMSLAPLGFNGSAVLRLKGCTTSDSRLSRPSSLNRALQGSKQTLNGQSGKWAARPR